MTNTFENIYDLYSPMLYSIALQLCPTTQKADRILILTFQKVHQQNLYWQDKKPFCIDLIKLIINTAQEELYPGKTKCNFKIKLFQKTPLIHKLLVEQLSLENYCSENNITHRQAMLNIREEFKLIRTACSQNVVAAGVSDVQFTNQYT